MPQLDNLTYFSQLFWFFFCFWTLYFSVINNILENIFKNFRLRFFYLDQSELNFFIISKNSLIYSKIVFNFYFLVFKSVNVIFLEWFSFKLYDIFFNSIFLNNTNEE